eukprot:5761283-Prymnesium_polylepis.5
MPRSRPRPFPSREYITHAPPPETLLSHRCPPRLSPRLVSRPTLLSQALTHLRARALDVHQEIAPARDKILVEVLKSARRNVVIDPPEAVSVQLAQHRAQVVVLEELRQHVFLHSRRVLDHERESAITPARVDHRGRMRARVEPALQARCAPAHVLAECWIGEHLVKL